MTQAAIENPCGTCRRCIPVEPDRGLCTRFPPQTTREKITDPVPDTVLHSDAPRVPLANWTCGEWQPKPGPLMRALERLVRLVRLL